MHYLMCLNYLSIDKFKMIKEEINVRGKQIFLNISEAQIQEEVARIIEERDQD